VKVFETGSFRSPLSLPHQTSTKAAVFSPDGKSVATGDRNALVRVWDIVTGVPFDLKGHRGTVHSLAYSPDGNSLASSGSDGTVHVWDVATKEPRFVLQEHSGPVYGVAYSPDPEKPRLATAGWDGTVRIWNAATGSQIHTIKLDERDVWTLSFGGGGKLIAAAGIDGVRVWDADTAQQVAYFRTERAMHTVRFGKDGQTLAAAGRDGVVRVWELPKQ
jgi:WD40 repeat protein